jgi:hypothetical protein
MTVQVEVGNRQLNTIQQEMEIMQLKVCGMSAGRAGATF